MHKYVRMTILTPSTFLQNGVNFVFPCFLAIKKDEVEQLWCIYSHGDFLGVLISDFAIFRSM